MAICVDKNRNLYIISYKYHKPNGELATKVIRNKEWKVSGPNKVTRRKLKAYESQYILEDIEANKEKENVNEEKMKLEELTDMYIESLDGSSKWGTIYSKVLIIKNYILKYFNKQKPVDEVFTLVTVSKFHNYINQLTLHSSQKNKIQRILKELMEFGVTYDLLSYSTIKKLEKPLVSFKDFDLEDKKDDTFWTNEEYEKFINTFEENDKWKLFFNVTYYGALRIGEAIALTFSDIDFNNKTIKINKMIDARGKLTTTKTISSNASVSLPTWLIEDLKKYKESIKPEDSDYLFFIKHTSRTSVRRVMNTHSEEAGIKHLKIHGLRHSMASRMINAGLNPLIVSKHLRHSSTQQTLDTYSHLFPNATKDVMDKI